LEGEADIPMAEAALTAVETRPVDTEVTLKDAEGKALDTLRGMAIKPDTTVTITRVSGISRRWAGGITATSNLEEGTIIISSNSKTFNINKLSSSRKASS
jgi:hypothetical protein